MAVGNCQQNTIKNKPIGLSASSVKLLWLLTSRRENLEPHFQVMMASPTIGAQKHILSNIKMGFNCIQLQKFMSRIISLKNLRIKRNQSAQTN